MLLLIIRLYQKTLSPDHGPLRHLHPFGFCPFQPTCSQYGYESIHKYGSLRGGFRTIKRLLRCHPWATGGKDPA